MKFSLFIILLITISIYSDAQTSACPSISVSSPINIIKSGDSMTFTFDIKGEKIENLKINWEVSNGTIISGQGTKTLLVATTKEMTGQAITATIEIIGLPENCPNAASAIGEIALKPLIKNSYPKGFSYKKISFKEEMQFLQNISTDAEKYPDVQVYFLFSKSKKQNRKLLKNRLIKIEKYLTETLKLSKDRFTFVFNSFDSYETGIWFIPLGVEPPESNGEKPKQDDWQKRFDEAFPSAKKSTQNTKKTKN